VTGKPVLFFAPDYDRYVHADRGSYFDLRDEAPGPVLARFDETVEAIASAQQIRQSWDPAYRDWVAKFNAWDDGQASARAVDALLKL
jgi:CDP-glycerol glycerophosphotransferase